MKKPLYILALFIGFFSNSQDLLGEWFLHYVSVDNVIYQHDVISDPLNLMFSETDFTGTICNSFWSNYNFDEINHTISIEGLYHTLGSCSDPNDPPDYYESFLFGIFMSENSPTIINYEIIGPNTNQTLTLTNENGNFALYGRQTLSINSFKSQSNISFFPNPVIDDINIISESNLENCLIFDINGKLIMNLKMNTLKSINVSRLKSGIYFAKFLSSKTQTTTIKFIKL